MTANQTTIPCMLVTLWTLLACAEAIQTVKSGEPAGPLQGGGESRQIPVSIGGTETETGKTDEGIVLEKSMVAQALGAPAPTASGAAASPAQTSHQWVLFGVVAGTSGRGSALIGVDGQVPRAFKLGQTVLPGWVLHSVERRLARLAPSMQETPSVTLQLPAQPE